MVAMQCDTFSPSNVDLLHWRLSCAAETDRLNKSAAFIHSRGPKIPLGIERRKT